MEQGGAAAMGKRIGRTGMLWLLASDAFGFAALFFAYGWTRRFAPVFHEGSEPGLNVGWGVALTAVLVVSSVAMGLAMRWMYASRQRAALLAVAITALCGVLFVLMQLEEYFGLLGILPGLTHEGLWLGVSPFASLFYALTGFHGLHVLSCVVATVTLALGIAMNKVTPSTVSVVGYWVQFVHVVWPFIFATVYF
jgi:heme/copper-type cytochrome/quinol oxidase subunit 3